VAGEPIDLQTALGATTGASATMFSLYLPDSDRDGQPVPQLEQWIDVAMTLFADINGGATRLPFGFHPWSLVNAARRAPARLWICDGRAASGSSTIPT
jgi:hypothetical protein